MWDIEFLSRFHTMWNKWGPCHCKGHILWNSHEKCEAQAGKLAVQLWVDGKKLNFKLTRILMVSHTYPWGVPETSWTQGGPGNDTRDLWHRWWEGPKNHGVDECPRRWKRLPSMETRRHEDKAMSYACLWCIDIRMLKNTSIKGVS